MYNGFKSVIALLSLGAFGIALFESIYGFKQIINPGINHVYNWIGPHIAPNMVTNIVFDWRGYDTLGEALILVTAVVVTLLIFGRGKVRLGGE